MNNTKEIDKHGMFEFKYIGIVPKKYLEDLFLELDAVKPWYVQDAQLNTIMTKNNTKTGLRVYYSERNNEFMLEPCDLPGEE